MVVMLSLVIALFLSVEKGEFVFLRRENGVVVFIERKKCGPMRSVNKEKMGHVRLI